MNKKHFAALGTTGFLALSGVAAGGAQAAPVEAGPPRGPVNQLPLSPVSQQNAVRKAKQYLNYTAFSRDGLINQLIEAKNFTPSQAAYGVSAVGL